MNGHNLREQDKVQHSLVTVFAHLYRLQTKQVNHPGGHRGTASADHSFPRNGHLFLGADPQPGTHPNPLWQSDGVAERLPTTPEGTSPCR